MQTDSALMVNAGAVSASGGRPLHVLVISNHWDVPFSAPFIDRQLTSLREAGVKISIFNIGTAHSPLHLFRKWRALRHDVRKLNPDLIHARYGTIVSALAVLSGRPTAITFNGSDLLPGASISTIRTYVGILLSNLAALFANGIICVSEELRRALLWKREVAVVISDGIDLNLFSPGSQREARSKLGWDLTRPVVILNAKRDPKNKGLDLAESAMKVVRLRVPEAELHVISNVEPDLMPFYYRAADVLLLASKQEGSPNVVKEALACNLPVVSVPVGDVAERLAGVQPSAVVPREPSVLGDALVRILLNRERSNGRSYVAHLSLEETAHRILLLYRSILRLNGTS